MLVAADEVDLAEKSGIAEADIAKQYQRQHDPDDPRHAKHIDIADGAKSRWQVRDGKSLGHHQGDTARRRHRAERRNQGIDTKPCHQSAIDEPDQRADDERRQNGGGNTPPGRHQIGADRAGQRQDRADRQIEPTRYQQIGHADDQDAGRHQTGAHGAEICHGHEMRGHRRHDHDDDRDHDQQGELASRREFSQAGADLKWRPMNLVGQKHGL